MKKLYKSNTNRIISGVCGGIAECYNLDASIVRLVLVALSFISGLGIALYVVAIVIIPEDNGFNGGNDVVDAPDYKDME